MVTQNNIFKNYQNWILIIIIIAVNIFGFIAAKKNYYHSVLFYPNKDKTKLIAERRAIIKGKNKLERIKNTIEELLLGPMDYKIQKNNIIPINSKLLSLRLENKTLHLNFNKEFVMEVNYKKNQISIYYILIQSIVNSICFQNRDIKKVKFYFNDKEYRFIGDIGPADNGFSPDWSILNK